MQENKLYVQRGLGTGAGKSVGALLLSVRGDLCYESVPGPLLRLIFSRDAGMLGNCAYFDFNVLLFCILTQNNAFPLRAGIRAGTRLWVQN